MRPPRKSHMKKLQFVSILMVIAILPILFGISYAQTSSKEKSNEQLFIYLNIRVRNAAGQLVTYLEESKIYYDTKLLNQVLDTMHPKIIKTGQTKSELYSIDLQKNYNVSETIGRTTLNAIAANGTEIMVAFSNHDGYPVVPGDTAIWNWTVIKPGH